MHFPALSGLQSINKIDREGMNNYGPEKSRERKTVTLTKNDSFSPVSIQLQKEIESIICVVADKKSIPALINLLDDNDFEIRWIAAESLIRIGRKSILPLLRTMSNGKHSHYSMAGYVLECLLTKSEKRSMHSLLASLSGDPAETATELLRHSWNS